MKIKNRLDTPRPGRIWKRILIATAVLVTAHFALIIILPHLNVIERILSATSSGDLVYVLFALLFLALRLFTLVIAPGIAAAAAFMLIAPKN